MTALEAAKNIFNKVDGWNIYGAARNNKLKSLGLNKDEVNDFVNRLKAGEVIEPEKKIIKAKKKTITKKTDNSVYHIVKENETITRIANKYKISPVVLMRLNKNTDKKIKPGMKLKVR